MSQWQELLSKMGTARDIFRNHYDPTYISIEIRERLAETIEEILSHTAYPDERPEKLPLAREYIANLINKINELLQLEPSSLSLGEAKRNLNRWLSDPLRFYKYIIKVLSDENEFISTPLDNLNDECSVTSMIAALIGDVDIMREQKDQFIQNMSHITNLNLGNIEELQRQSTLNNLREIYIKFTMMSKQLYHLIEIQLTVVLSNYLENWKRNQLHHSSENTSCLQLEAIQKWCEELYKIISCSRECVAHVKDNQHFQRMNWDSSRSMEEIHKKFTELLEKLFISSFVIEKQPQQVLKTNNRCKTVIRFLIGRALAIESMPVRPLVKATVVSERNFRPVMEAMQQNLPYTENGNSIIEDNVAEIGYSGDSNGYIVEFRNMTLRKRVRDNSLERRENETVMDRKIALLFSTNLPNFPHITLHVMSIPIVLMVHSLQEPRCWATITWNNAYYNANTDFTKLVSELPWRLLAPAIKNRFRKHTGCTRPLSDENMEYLCQKICRDSNNSMISGDTMITWKKFCVDSVDRQSFWGWFTATMKLIHDHLARPYDDGYIMGYIGRESAEALLQQSTDGTFILRFSDSFLGAITIAVINKNRMINHLGPLCTNDLGQLSLPERILQIDDLCYVYSNGCKVNCFAHYQSETNRRTTNGRYIRMLIQNVVPPQPQLSASLLNHDQVNVSPQPSPSESFLNPPHVSINQINVSSQPCLNPRHESISDATATAVNVRDLNIIPTEGLLANIDFCELETIMKVVSDSLELSSSMEGQQQQPKNMEMDTE